MNKILFFIQSFIAKVVGLGFACFLSFILMLRFIRHPIKFITGTFFTTREAPACLKDPSLGTHGYIHLQDVKLHYVACGDQSKPLMLCLHGFPEFWYSWRYQIREFSKDYRVVAVDQRGYGESDKPSGKVNYTTDKLAADIKQLIPALGYESCVLLGHDWGGAVAWHVATSYPDMVDKLIVFNCPHPGVFQKYIKTHRSQAKKSWYMMFFQVPIIPELLIMSFDLEAMEKMMKSIKNAKTTPEDVEAYKYNFSHKGGITGPVNWYRAAFSYPIKLGSKGNKLTKPTLIIWGKPDHYLEEGMAPLAADYVTNLTVKYIENTNHFVQMDKPEECNRIMREFLQ